MQGQLTPSFGDYELIDTGDFEKLERFGQYVARRPEPQAIWRRSLPEGEWRRMADAAFLRDVRSDERGEWRLRPGMPPRWTVAYEYKDMALRMRLGLTSFKHVGIFPEQAANWNFIYDNCRALVSGGTFSCGYFRRGCGREFPAGTRCCSAVRRRIGPGRALCHRPGVLRHAARAEPLCLYGRGGVSRHVPQGRIRRMSIR